MAVVQRFNCRCLQVTFLLIAGISSQSNVQTTPNPKSSAESTVAHSTGLQGDTQGKTVGPQSAMHYFILGLQPRDKPGGYPLWWLIRGGSARRGYLFQASGI